MTDQVNTMGVTLTEYETLSSGIGYIALPADIDRDRYILDCYQNMRVSLHTAHDGFQNRVIISEDDLNWIEFPTDYRSFGTVVYYITNPISGEKYIVKLYSNSRKLGGGRENNFSIGRAFKDSLVQIDGNPEAGNINIIVSNNDKSQLNINVLNKDDRGELNVNVKGNSNVVATGDVNFSANGNYYVKVSDPETKGVETEFIQTINSLRINSPSFLINNGKENFVLGQKLVSFLEDLLKEVSSSTVATALGTMPLNNATQISAFKEKLNSLLSEVAFIDK